MAGVPAYDPEHIAATSLKRTMLGISAITDIVGANKIIWMMLGNEATKMPYVSIRHSDGGYETNEMTSNTGNVIMKMSIFTTDKATAVAFRSAIASLHKATLDTSDFTNVTPYSTVYQINPFREVDIAQSIPIYEVGGYYEIRFNIN